MEDDAGSSTTSTEPHSHIETAIRSFVSVLSNAQSKVQAAGEPPSGEAQRPGAARIQKEMYRSFPSVLNLEPEEAKQVLTSGDQLDLKVCFLPYKSITLSKKKILLLQPGLEKRHISIDFDAGHEQISRALYEVYPKLKDLAGGWQLYRLRGESLTAVARGSKGYSAEMLKITSGYGNLLLYVAPLHK